MDAQLIATKGPVRCDSRCIALSQHILTGTSFAEYKYVPDACHQSHLTCHPG